MSLQEITINEAQRLTSPNPFALLTVRKPEGGTNVMALSWWSYASNCPPSVVVCLSKKGYSHTCIQAAGCFGLSVPGASIAQAAYRCGTCSGRGADKAADLGLPLVSLEGFSQEMAGESRLYLSCRLTDSLEIGDHLLFVGQVERALADPSVPGLFALDGYARLGTV